MVADVLQTMEDVAGSLSFFSSAAVVVMTTAALVVSETETAAAVIPSFGSSSSAAVAETASKVITAKQCIHQHIRLEYTGPGRLFILTAGICILSVIICSRNSVFCPGGMSFPEEAYPVHKLLS